MSTAPDPDDPGTLGDPARAATPASKIILLALNAPLLIVFLLVVFTQPAGSVAPGVQSAPTGTVGPVFTTGAQSAATPAVATSTPVVTGASHHGGKGAPTATPHARATATATPSPTATATPTATSTATPPVATVTPAPTVTPIPTVGVVPVSGG